MAQQSKSKKPTEKSNTAFTKKTTRAKPSADNSAKYEPTKEAQMDLLQLDPSDGVMKLFTDGLKDIYWAENHLLMVLPRMAKNASLAELQDAILQHLEETKQQAERLEQVFDILGKKPQAKKCDAMEGLAKEGEAIIETTDAGTPARDLGIIMASQKVEHYEIASYTGLVNLAASLGLQDVADILSGTLEEEQNADNTLAEIANSILSSLDSMEDEENMEEE